MRSHILITFFLALFALFSTVAYAAPVSPQGEISKRQCSMYGCRESTTGTPSSGSGSDALLELISKIISLYSSGNTANTPPAVSSPAPPNPTGT